MKVLFTLIFISISLTSNATEYRKLLACHLLSDTLDESLPSDSSMYSFEFHGLDIFNTQLIYSSGSETITHELGEEKILNLILPSGKYQFEFFVSGFIEIATQKLEIIEQHHSTYRVQMNPSFEAPLMRKPVIYLYPEQEVDVSMKLDINGQNPFYYPQYEDTWNFVAHPNGELNFDDKTYNYLFWEANMNAPEIDRNYGFLVEGHNSIEFLEKQLDLMGFTSKEQADFITFWGPQLIQHKLTYVNFVFNDSCNEFAELSIEPQPDNIFRVSMIWQPVEDPWELKPQKIKKINRDGFTVIEWGGLELPPITIN